MAGERPAKRSPAGRRTLSDITNQQPQPAPKLTPLKENGSQIRDPSGDIIARLLQEKAALLKIVEERNKLLELSASQLQNLRIRYQTLLLQNRSLAQSHSQMLAELNSGKDRLKHLQHDLLCKDALLNSRNSEPKENPDINHPKLVSKTGEEEAAGCLQKANNDKKPGRKKGTRSRSMGSPTVQAEAEKEKAETKRRSSKRQSARFVERESEDNLFEIDEAKFTGSKSSTADEGQRSKALVEAASSKSSIEEPKTKRRCVRRQSATGFIESRETEPADNLFEIANTKFVESQPSIVQEQQQSTPRRISMGRPVRRATEKVCSYKEPSLVQKLRRPT